MTLYLPQKIIKKAGKTGEILKFNFSTALPEGILILSITRNIWQ